MGFIAVFNELYLPGCRQEEAQPGLSSDEHTIDPAQSTINLSVLYQRVGAPVHNFLNNNCITKSKRNFCEYTKHAPDETGVLSASNQLSTMLFFKYTSFALIAIPINKDTSFAAT